MTHEFAHHVMYAMGLSFEDYKKEELMADAFAAYFLAHNSGGDMTSSEISNIHRVAFSVGDCETSDAFHSPQAKGKMEPKLILLKRLPRLVGKLGIFWFSFI